MSGKIIIQLSKEIKKDGEWYVSHCPEIDVYSQGRTKKEAAENLNEAARLFFISCIERGVLDQALRECGFSAKKTLGKTKTGAAPASRQASLEVTIPLNFKHKKRELCHA